MLRAARIALLIAAVCGFVAWLFYQNGHEVTLHLSDGQKLVFPMAVHILLALGLGSGLVFLAFLARGALGAFGRMGRRRRERHQRAADQLREEGARQLWSGDLRGARKSLTRAFRQRPADLEAALALARAHEEREEWQDALDVLEGVRAAHQGSEPRLLSRIGRLALARGNSGAAVDAFREAVQADPESPRLLAELAVALATEGQFQEAAETAGRWLAQEKEESRRDYARREWFSLRYRAALAKTDAKTACDALQKLVREAPAFLPPVLELARLLRQDGDGRGASRLYQAALRHGSRGVLLERIMALHASLGQADKALPLLRQIAKGNALVAPRLALARTLIAADQLPEATTLLEELSRTATETGGVDAAPERDLVAGELAAADDNDREAATLFRRAADGSHRPFSYACRSCHRLSDTWNDTCECGVLGELEWRIGDAKLADPT
jgi:predicted Zn-dependent protease